jgi:hypothetical protein
VRQLELELTYINQAGITPDAGRASNDNLLDIIDIVQGDTNLANMASQGGINGFSPFPDALNPTPRYIDNDAQTTFWANFIAQSNSLGQQANNLVGSGDTAAYRNPDRRSQDVRKERHRFRRGPGRHLRSEIRQ